MEHSAGWLKASALVVVVFVFLGCGNSTQSQHGVDDFVAWRIKEWRDSYCARDQHPDNEPFTSATWLKGGRDDRGRMARELICSSVPYGLTKPEIIQLLGESDRTEEDVLVYRITRSRPFRKYEPPAPTGYRVLPGQYDLRLVFESGSGMSWMDVLPAIEADS